MKILVLGAYHSSNLGDPVICDCVADSLRRRFPEAEVCCHDLIRRTAPAPGQESPMQAGRKTHLRRKLRFWVTEHTPFDASLRWERYRLKKHAEYLDHLCAQDWDLAVVAGGQLLMDSYALFLAHAIEALTRRRVPVICNALGVGPSCSDAVCARLGAALAPSCVRQISCRDDAALAQKRYAPGKEICETADPALYAGRTYGVARDTESKTVGLGILFPGFTPKAQTLAFWQGVIRGLEAKQTPWQMFTNGDPLDLSYAREIVASMPELRGKEAELIRPRDIKPGDLVRTVAGYGGVIAARLHSNILAAALDIPAVAVVWDDKLPAFYEKIGRPGRCVTVDTDADTVLQTLGEAQQNGYDAALVESLRQDAEAMLLEAAERALYGEVQP